MVITNTIRNQEDHPLSKLQPAIEHALICIILTLAGHDAALYVNNFLDDFSNDVKIPRMDDY